MLSTIDNPFNPFVNFNEWYRFDMDMKYDTCGRLARITNFSDDMSEEEVDAETERAIKFLMENDVLGIFIRVYPDTVVEPIRITDDTNPAN